MLWLDTFARHFACGFISKPKRGASASISARETQKDHTRWMTWGRKGSPNKTQAIQKGMSNMQYYISQTRRYADVPISPMVTVLSHIYIYIFIYIYILANCYNKNATEPVLCPGALLLKYIYFVKQAWGLGTGKQLHLCKIVGCNYSSMPSNSPWSWGMTE